MEEALHIFLHALKDSAMILPFLFLVYVLIEVIEMYSIVTLKAKHLLQGKFSPLIASSVGLIPQCGFSVAATDLFSKKYISVGTLLAVFIATSDEAIPIMVSNASSIKMLLPMLLIKFIAALTVGYSVYFIQKLIVKNKSKKMPTTKNLNVSANTITKPVEDEKTENVKEIENVKVNENEEHDHEHCDHDHEHEHCDHDHEHESIYDGCSIGCCGHHLEEKPSKLKRFLLHPLIHSLRVFAFILIVNLILGTIIHFVGPDKLGQALGVNTFWQPLVSALIGLIPNCAASVVITQFYVAGTLSFGAAIAGLTANAGVAYVVLFKHNKNIKENLLIMGSMYLISIVLGFITMLIF